MWKILFIVIIIIVVACFSLLSKSETETKTKKSGQQKRKGVQPLSSFPPAIASSMPDTPQKLPDWLQNEFDDFVKKALSYELFKRSLKEPLPDAAKKKLATLPQEMAPPPLLLGEGRRKAGWNSSQVEKALVAYWYKKTGKLTEQNDDIYLLIEGLLVQEAEKEADTICRTDESNKL